MGRARGKEEMNANIIEIKYIDFLK